MNIPAPDRSIVRHPGRSGHPVGDALSGVFLSGVFLLVGVLVVACLVGAPAVAQESGAGADTAEAPAQELQLPPGMEIFYLGLIYRGDAWTPEVTDETRRLQEGHMANMRRLAEEGSLVLAGPFLDDTNLRGIFVFRADSLEAAEALAASDPAVQAGRLRVDLRPWMTETASLALAAAADASGADERPDDDTDDTDGGEAGSSP